MKYLMIASLFLMSLVSQVATAQNSIDWQAVRQAYFDKYHPTDTPAWIFPIVLEEGNGGRDTLYLVYDAMASPIFPIDAALGERYEVVEKSVFNAFWSSCCDAEYDTVQKVMAGESSSLGSPFLGFSQGILPLIIWWEPGSFYSDSLPFADQSPAPRAEGLFTNPGGIELKGEPYSGFCSLQFPILLTDTAKSPDFCYRKDSLVYLRRFSGGNVLPMLSFGVGPWTGEWLGIKDAPDEIQFVIFPQPAFEFIRIKLNGEQIDKIVLLNSLGQIVHENDDYIAETPISLISINPGLYFVQIYIGEYSFIKKIIKL